MMFTQGNQAVAVIFLLSLWGSADANACICCRGLNCDPEFVGHASSQDLCASIYSECAVPSRTSGNIVNNGESDGSEDEASDGAGVPDQISNLLHRLSSFHVPTRVSVSLGVIFLPIGLLIALAGYRVYKFFLFVIGFFLTGILSVIYLCEQNLEHNLGDCPDDHTPYMYYIMASVLGGFIFVWLCDMAVFLSGFCVGAFIATLVITHTCSTCHIFDTIPLITVIVAGSIVGCAALELQKVIIMLNTSYLGSYLVWSSIFYGFFQAYDEKSVVALLSLGSTAPAFYIQWKYTGVDAREADVAGIADVEDPLLPNQAVVEPDPTPSMTAGAVVEPEPTLSMIAGAAPPSGKIRAPPPGWQLKESQQYAGKCFYWHEATQQSTWFYPRSTAARGIADVEDPLLPNQAVVEPDPTPSMTAGAAPPSGQIRAPPPGWTVSADMAYEEGKKARARDQWEEAVYHFGRALDMGGIADPRVMNQRGQCLERLGRWEAAFADYDNAVKLTTDQRAKGAMHSNRGKAHAVLGRLQYAVADFDRAVALGYSKAAKRRDSLRAMLDAQTPTTAAEASQGLKAASTSPSKAAGAELMPWDGQEVIIADSEDHDPLLHPSRIRSV